jgi:hypothetical protein
MTDGDDANNRIFQRINQAERKAIKHNRSAIIAYSSAKLWIVVQQGNDAFERFVCAGWEKYIAGLSH